MFVCAICWTDLLHKMLSIVLSFDFLYAKNPIHVVVYYIKTVLFQRWVDIQKGPNS